MFGAANHAGHPLSERRGLSRVVVRPPVTEGTRALDLQPSAEPLQEIDQWLDGYRALWESRLDKMEDLLRQQARQGESK